MGFRLDGAHLSIKRKQRPKVVQLVAANRKKPGYLVILWRLFLWRFRQSLWKICCVCGDRAFKRDGFFYQGEFWCPICWEASDLENS
jgi:hypothetical protein